MLPFHGTENAINDGDMLSRTIPPGGYKLETASDLEDRLSKTARLTLCFSPYAFFFRRQKAIAAARMAEAQQPGAKRKKWQLCREANRKKYADGRTKRKDAADRKHEKIQSYCRREGLQQEGIPGSHNRPLKERLHGHLDKGLSREGVPNSARHCRSARGA